MRVAHPVSVGVSVVIIVTVVAGVAAVFTRRLTRDETRELELAEWAAGMPPRGSVATR